MTDLEKAARMALGNICSAKLCEINSMSSRQEMIRLMDEAITALRQALSDSVEQPAKQRHIAYVCPQCHWTLEEQPAQQEPTGYTTGINWQPRQSEMVVKIVRNKQPEHGFVHAIYTSPQPAQQKSVGYVYSVHGERIKNACIESDVPNGAPLYILPQRKPWVGLTDEERKRAIQFNNAHEALAVVIEAKLKEKNA